MAHPGRQARPSTTPTAYLAAFALGLMVASLTSLAWPVASTWQMPLLIVAAGALFLAAFFRRGGRHRLAPTTDPIDRLASQVRRLGVDAGRPLERPDAVELRPLFEALEELRMRLAAEHKSSPSLLRTRRGGIPEAPAAPMAAGLMDPTASGDFGTLDIVNRLEPKELHWLESSSAEQEFLGWTLAQLRQKSFLEIVHPDDRNLAWEQLQAALIKGEAHGLIFRIKTARGDPRAIEVNAGVRYGPDMTVSHLRCHITDVTAKVRAGRELRRRTRELTLVNQQLRRTNRELQELKDRYGDLYQNAPAMYFSLDERGDLIECNDTLLRTLGYPRHELIGRPYIVLLEEARKAAFPAYFSEFLRTGYIEVESRWQKANGEVLDVWVTGTAVRGPDGAVQHSRSVAQDVTARRALEAELKEKNDRLAHTNSVLSRKIEELDEFTYVVSHDLQEPLRTLIAFSDFLMKDYGDRLDANGQEYVRYLVDASRRLRSLISNLLDLSRVGKVAGDFDMVNPATVIDGVKADLSERIRERDADVRVVGELPILWGDRDRIGQLFANLVANGLKYNQSPAPVVEIGVLADDSPAFATMFVRDNGIGIDPSYHLKIFQIFRRLHSHEEYEGTGAGLAICQKVVQAHGGRIWVESEVGRGATFYFTLPRLVADSPAPRTEVLHAP